MDSRPASGTRIMYAISVWGFLSFSSFRSPSSSPQGEGELFVNRF
jgi:hypothetical protein